MERLAGRNGRNTGEIGILAEHIERCKTVFEYLD
jgi:hypothetical protein